MIFEIILFYTRNQSKTLRSKGANPDYL